MCKSKGNPNIRAIKLWHSLCPAYFPLMIAIAFFENLSPYFNIYMSAAIINEIVGTRDTRKLILLVLITTVGNLIVTVIGGILNREFGHKTTIFDQKESALFSYKTLTLDYDDLENPAVRQLRRKIIESAKIDCHGKQSLLSELNSLIYNVINIILAVCLFVEMFVLIVSATFNLIAIILIGLLIILIALNVWITFFVTKKISRFSNNASQTMIDENRIDDALDCYNMGKDVRLYRQDKLIMKIKNFAFDLHKKAFKELFSKKFKVEIILWVLSYFLQALTYLFVCIYAIQGVFGVGNIVKYVGVIQRLINAIINMFSICGEIKYNTPFIEDYLAFLDIPRKMQNGTKSIKDKSGSNDITNYEIEFCNVSFKYPASDVYALRNVSIKLKHGGRLAIVGMNGSGKTTFIKLLCRLYDPTEGKILLNGIDIKKYNYDEYMSIFSVVFQDFKLFSFSLGQNVAASINYEEAKVEACLQKAGFGDRFVQMPKGTKTYLYKDFDENGVEISGGEAQKIAFARALYKNAPFIILDEPTAALDPIAEYDIYSRFNDIVGEKTAIYISHRLSSCRFCDDIIVFHQGEVIQRGSHETLIANEDGKYYELWNAQAQYYSS